MRFAEIASEPPLFEALPRVALLKLSQLGRDPLPGGCDVDLAGIDVLEAIQNHLGFVTMQLTHFEGEDPSPAIGEHREGEDGIHPKGFDRGQTILFADENRIIDADRACVLRYRIF